MSGATLQTLDVVSERTDEELLSVASEFLQLLDVNHLLLVEKMDVPTGEDRAGRW